MCHGGNVSTRTDARGFTATYSYDALNRATQVAYANQTTGLSYNYYRDYDPATGRYIESDPIGLHGGSYSTYAYAYANGNPALLVDPLGLAASCGDPCAQLRKQIFAKAAMLIKELLKYDPIADAKGGFPRLSRLSRRWCLITAKVWLPPQWEYSQFWEALLFLRFRRCYARSLDGITGYRSCYM